MSKITNERVIELFKDYKYTNKEIAEYCCVSSSAVSQIKRSGNIKDVTLKRLCQLLAENFLVVKYGDYEVIEAINHLMAKHRAVSNVIAIKKG
jgi:DNA-binding Xre family transcriptional regulator